VMPVARTLVPIDSPVRQVGKYALRIGQGTAIAHIEVGKGDRGGVQVKEAVAVRNPDEVMVFSDSAQLGHAIGGFAPRFGKKVVPCVNVFLIERTVSICYRLL